MKNISAKLKKAYTGIVTVFCIISIIVVCFFMNLWYEFGTTLKQIPDMMNTKSEIQAVFKPAPEPETEETPPNAEQIPDKTVEKVTAQPVYEEEIISADNKATFLPACPISGAEFGEYNGDRLTFSSVFGDYRKYNGVDIYAEVNTPVLAVEDGIVAKIKNDKIYGISIVINHNDGYSSIYKNLSADSIVKEGDKVTREQIISGVGENRNYKRNNRFFLHFELKKDGRDINPSEL